MSNENVLLEWIRDGPRPEDGILGWAIGSFLHWRMWGMLFAWMVPLVAGIWTLNRAGAFLAVVVTWFVGIIIAPHAMKIGAKYEVTENY